MAPEADDGREIVSSAAARGVAAAAGELASPAAACLHM